MRYYCSVCHSQFLRERPSFAVSLSTFCRAHPATVKLARFGVRPCGQKFCWCYRGASTLLPKDYHILENAHDANKGGVHCTGSGTLHLQWPFQPVPKPVYMRHGSTLQNSCWGWGSWSWLEKGNGKGLCDGVGSAVKKSWLITWSRPQK